MYRRRYRRRPSTRMAKLRRYGSRLRRGLDVTVQPGTVRDFDHAVEFNLTNSIYGSNPIRINGLGKYQSLEDFSLGNDFRYVQCCALYSEMRILSMNVEITMNGISGTNYSQTGTIPQPVEDLSRMFIMATVNRVTGNTMSYWTYDLMKNAPGTIISRSRNAFGYPRLSITIFPTTLQERTSWIRAGLRGDGCNASYASGNIIPFSPSVDFLLVCPGGINSKWADPQNKVHCSVSVVCRYRLMFRNAGGTSSSSKMVQLQDELRILENEMQQTDVHVTLPRVEITKDKKKDKEVEEDPNVHYPTHEEALQMEEDGGDDFGGGGAGHVVGTDGVVVADDSGEQFQRVPTNRFTQAVDTMRDILPGAGAAAATVAAAIVAAQAERAKNKILV